MGSACMSHKRNLDTADISSISLPKVAEWSAKAGKKTNFTLPDTKHYERYFNRQFTVSICTAQGQRRTMEDTHLCQFVFANHHNYSLFAVFDGHDGHKASHFLADSLYETLNNLPDLENNENIINSIKKLDEEYIGESGSTIVFVLTYSQCVLKLGPLDAASSQSSEPDSIAPIYHPWNSMHGLLDGMELEHKCRVFWCGDSRAYFIGSQSNCIDRLTVDHNCGNEVEVQRVKEEGGKILNGRVDGKLFLTRTFGAKAVKYSASGVHCSCEYKTFTAQPGDSMLIACDGLTERWSDQILFQKFNFFLNNVADKTDTAKLMGGLVDDAICEGSTDNISVMLVQFKGGKVEDVENKKYHSV